MCGLQYLDLNCAIIPDPPQAHDQLWAVVGFEIHLFQPFAGREFMKVLTVALCEMSLDPVRMAASPAVRFHGADFSPISGYILPDEPKCRFSSR